MVATREVGGEIEDLFEPILVPDSTAPEDAVYEVEISEDTETAGKDAWTLAVEAANRFAWEAPQSPSPWTGYIRCS